MNTNIILSNEVIMPATGDHVNGNSKSVACLTTGEWWPSVADAAKGNNMSPQNLSRVLHTSKQKYKGRVFTFLSETEDNTPVLLQRIQELVEMEAKARAWDAYQAELEAARKAEEARLEAIRKEEAKKLKAKQKRLDDIAKAENRVERRKRIVDKLHNDLARAEERVREAERELSVLKTDPITDEE